MKLIEIKTDWIGSESQYLLVDDNLTNDEITKLAEIKVQTYEGNRFVVEWSIVTNPSFIEGFCQQENDRLAQQIKELTALNFKIMDYKWKVHFANNPIPEIKPTQPTS